MNILLLEDVYNLGRAGDVKKVANGYGRNFLIPQGLALPATPGAVAQAEQIATEADKRRNVLNEELKSVADEIVEIQLVFPARAGETGKLYGSITTQAIAEALSEKIGREIDKRQIHGQPLRLLGMHQVGVRLTIDLIPEFSVVVYREGENPENYMVAAEELATEAEDTAPDFGAEMTEDIEAEAEMDAQDEVVEEAEEAAEAEVEGETATE